MKTILQDLTIEDIHLNNATFLEEERKYYSNMTDFDLQHCLSLYCNDNYFKKVVFLLTDPEFQNRIDVHYNKERAFRNAAQNGNINIIHFLLTSPFIKERVEINNPQHKALDWACEENHLELVKYLVSSPQLKEHANIYADNCQAFITAANCGYLDIVEYFIFELNIKYTESIEKFFKYEEISRTDTIQKMFEKRFLFEKLQNSINNEHLQEKHIVKV